MRHKLKNLNHDLPMEGLELLDDMLMHVVGGNYADFPASDAGCECANGDGCGCKNGSGCGCKGGEGCGCANGIGCGCEKK